MRLDHVQLAAPPDGEDAARSFFSGLLGLSEEVKPEPLAARGGVWFRGPDLVIHVGIETEFTPQRKAHAALAVANLDELAGRLERAGHEVRWDESLPERRRFYTHDPFGNRLEFIAEGDGFLKTAGRALWRAVDRYFAGKLLEQDDYLGSVLATNAREGLPAWEVSPLQAQFLAILIRATAARRILEVGTLGGYSTIVLARAIPEDGTVVTLEIDPDHAAVARSNIAGAGLHDRVEVVVGPAADTLTRMIGHGVPPFDMVFIDADKKSNPEYMRLSRRVVRSGGVIITDNVVRAGAVVDTEATDADVQGVRALMELLGSDESLISSAIQTVGEKGYDGFAITVIP